MTTNNHPANGPVSLDRLLQISEILSKAAAQSDGGNLDYAMADAVKSIDELLSVRKTAAQEAVYQVLDDGSWTDYSKQQLEVMLESKPSTLFRVAYPSPSLTQLAPVVADAVKVIDGAIAEFEEQDNPRPVMAVKGELGFIDNLEKIIEERDEDIDIGQLGRSNYDALMLASLDAFRASLPEAVGQNELPAYKIKRFGEFVANGLAVDGEELDISIKWFNFDHGTTPEPDHRGAFVEKYALQAIINTLQQRCDGLSDTPTPVIWPVAPQQEVKS
ncbi:hypothetical protein VBR58_001436 [Citrobacter freundii]|nr:hypothetical protein [Citrobacter freundii]ELJ9990935.1 hypothetical protein [Citrobacter freundii]ELS5366976.1 hypothetical protein [Citrobacter freundii]EMC0438632.1 hypothetical protein [Citrobacter freundii]EMD0452913.1 hypothetical protein [Citrobacter freundii]